MSCAQSIDRFVVLKAKNWTKQVLFSVCVVKILLSMLISKVLQMLDLTT